MICMMGYLKLKDGDVAGLESERLAVEADWADWGDE